MKNKPDKSIKPPKYDTVSEGCCYCTGDGLFYCIIAAIFTGILIAVLCFV
jgi:hypothetical protein